RTSNEATDFTSLLRASSEATVSGSVRAPIAGQYTYVARTRLAHPAKGEALPVLQGSCVVAERLPKPGECDDLGQAVAHLDGRDAAVVLLHLARRVAADRADYQIMNIRGTPEIL